MKEYEYSFKVKDINKYIAYCKENGYKHVFESIQVRELYRNSNKTLARITTTITNSKSKKVLDFKDDNQLADVLKVSRETIPLVIDEYNEKAVSSILDMLGYKKDKVLNRTRKVYKKDEVKMELDSYTSPEVMYVVGIEGESEKVDCVYKEVVEKIGEIIE